MSGLGRASREREAREIADPRIEEVVTRFAANAAFTESVVAIDRAHAEDWTVDSVRVVEQDATVAIRIGVADADGYGNEIRRPGAPDTYISLKGYGLNAGILSTPTDRDITLIFTLAPKSAPHRLRDVAPYIVKAQTPPADVHPA